MRGSQSSKSQSHLVKAWSQKCDRRAASSSWFENLLQLVQPDVEDQYKKKFF